MAKKKTEKQTTSVAVSDFEARLKEYFALHGTDILLEVDGIFFLPSRRHEAELYAREKGIKVKEYVKGKSATEGSEQD